MTATNPDLTLIVDGVRLRLTDEEEEDIYRIVGIRRSPEVVGIIGQTPTGETRSKSEIEQDAERWGFCLTCQLPRMLARVRRIGEEGEEIPPFEMTCPNGCA